MSRSRVSPWWIRLSWPRGRSRRPSLFVNENTQRVRAQQKDAPIFVIIGNPPYNAKQVNENDNSKNRKYPDD